MARRQHNPDTAAAELVRDVQRLARSHREQEALLGDVVDSVADQNPDGSAVAHLSSSLLAELRSRTGR